MTEQQRDKIEYDFEDLRRNEDPVPDNVLEQLGLDEEDLTEDERHDDKKARDDSEELDDREDQDAELDEDGEYNPAKMTTAMRKRIQKIRRDASREIAEAKEEAGQEISKLTKRIDELEKAGKTDELEDEFGGKIEALEAQIEEAMEAGETKTVTSLTRELAELTTDMRLKKRDLEREHDEPEDLDDQEEVKLIPRAAEWIREQDWWDEAEYGHVRDYVRKADLALQNKGYKPTDEDFYEQLENLVEKKYPGVVVKTVDDDDLDDDLDLEEELDEEDEFEEIPDKRRRKAKKRGRRKSPVSGGDSVNKGTRKVRKKRGKTLTKAQVANMRIFNMDPEDPEHVEAYLENNP